VLISWPFSFEFLSKMVCHAPSVGFRLFLFVFFIFVWLSIITLVVFMRSSNLLDPLVFLYHAPALRGQLWSLSFFAPPPVWGVILVNVIFKNVIGSKWDCKGYISALWKDYQRWSSSSQTHTLRIDRSCFHARMQSDLFIQIKLSFWVTSWGFFFCFCFVFFFQVF